MQTQAPGYYRMMLGKFEITVLSDGTTSRAMDHILSKPDEVRAILAADHEPEPYEVSINAFLINTRSNLVLVDTGAGELFGPDSGGRLVSNLRAAGYEPDQIDTILLTHIHADHSGGLSVGGQRQFPDAVVYVDQRDPALWLDPEKEQSAPEAAKRIFRQSHATIDPYLAVGKFRTFDGATNFFPGIRSLPAYGHTPGHTAYLIESQGHTLLLWGDTVHCAEAQFQDPEVAIQYDVDAAAAVSSRKRLMTFASATGCIVGGAHISFPGLGHVRDDHGGYVWLPLPYSVDGTIKQ